MHDSFEMTKIYRSKQLHRKTFHFRNSESAFPELENPHEVVLHKPEDHVYTSLVFIGRITTGNEYSITVNNIFVTKFFKDPNLPNRAAREPVLDLVFGELEFFQRKQTGGRRSVDSQVDGAIGAVSNFV
jgi:hypothetical protein